ncbi:PREDICTED: long-chain-fatty-acid--CoA ligase 5 [Dipodomys ordii]|uniref:long-chain-fatty-acid--CoA ligase n=1 Tax=Dipodomys ordii TaxID=10020 RepID=A0A1S3F9W5_DIPOR|nr:PREDICTED: long-chain-fatty-acid--CoA ligase 5 [Dipodomys ordii]
MLFIFNFLFSPLPTPALICLLTFGTAIFLWLINRPQPFLSPIDLDNQSVGIEGGARKGAYQKNNDLMRYYFSDAKTVYEIFQRGLAVSDNGPCLGYRKPNQPYRWLSYKQVSDRAEYLGSCLLYKGYKPSPDQFVGIFAQNRPEWVISELACYTYSMVAVPLYDTLGAEAIIYIVNKEYLKKFAAVVYSCGARVGFFQGDIRLLPDDMKALKPTVFPTVPRLLNRVYDKVQNEAKTPLSKFMLNLAITSKYSDVKNGIIRRDSLWDKFIFSKIQDSLGGNVRIMITGAAPISTQVLTFLRAALGCWVFEAYGQTECTAGCTITSPGDWTTGHVGVPVSCNYVKLEDVADMNYFSVNNEGEVCIKGTNVFQGYLKDPEKTQEALDKDGWLHTGDIGRWLPNGTLKIIDRKKNIFKLAQGEYIAPEKIENIYIRSRLVLQVFVHGDSLRSSLVGVVVPDSEVLPSFAAKLGIKGSFEVLCENETIQGAILQDLQKVGKEGGLKSFEQVKSIFIHPEPFSIENGLLTPTLKAKRVELCKFFRTQINSLYESIQE